MEMKKIGKLSTGRKLSVEEQKLIIGGGHSCYRYDYSTGFVYESRYFDSTFLANQWCINILNSSQYGCYCE